MRAAIRAIEYHLPDHVLSTEQLAREYPEWSVEKVAERTGIRNRRIAADDECASDLAVAAARKLFAAGVCDRNEVDFLLFCTQSPDYLTPTTACLVQERLGIPVTAGALDINLGSSGYVYGLGLAKGLIESAEAKRVLLITADTYSKFIRPDDRTVRPLFGDGATATMLESVDADIPLVGPFVYGTDGRGAANLMVAGSGMRGRRNSLSNSEADSARAGNHKPEYLFMDGLEIFNFVVSVVPGMVKLLLAKGAVDLEEVDLFIFHQANRQMLEHVRRRLEIPKERFCIYLEDSGNTASSSIPIALKHALLESRLKRDHLVMLVGFGPGYSWGGCLVRWNATG